MSLRIFFGWLLTLVGGLVALLAGGCTLIFAGSEIWSALERGRFSKAGEMLFTAALVGGIPFILGVIFCHWGRRLTRKDWNMQLPPSRSAPSSGGGIGEHLGYAFREVRDEFALFFGGGGRRPDSGDDGPEAGKK